MLLEENQLEIIDCGVFVPYSCSWRMNFYETMFLVFKGSIIFLLIMHLSRKTKVLVKYWSSGGGEGATFENYGGGVQHAS